MRPRVVIPACLMLALVAPARAGADGVRYVDDDARPGGDGRAWSSAYRHLQTALAEAGRDVHEIRVAAGTHVPDRGGKARAGDREATFLLRDGLAVRGGYLGLGAGPGEDPDERDVARHETILTGDLQGNDGPGFAGTVENSFHVVVALEVDETAVLDGVTVHGGRADGPHYGPSPASQDQGSAVNVYFATPTLVDCTFTASWTTNHGALNDHGGATVRGCTFEGNHAASHGGGLYIHDDVTTTVEACRFLGNTTAGRGGGAYTRSTTSTLTGCVFVGNDADEGGGMYADAGSRTVVAASVFEGNTASIGGGMYNNAADTVVEGCVFEGNVTDVGDGGGGIWNQGGGPVVRGSTFRGNVGKRGGGLYNGTGSTALIEGCAFTANRCREDGGGMSNDSSRVTVVGCTFTANVAAEGSFVVGGGMSNYFASTRVENCMFIGNVVRDGFVALGGGMYNESSFGAGFTITGCAFVGNRAESGGGLYNFRSSPTVVGCALIGNRATGAAGFGGGAANDFDSNGTFVNCTIVANVAAAGGGVQGFRATPRLTNCVVWGNAPGQVVDGAGAAAVVSFSNVQGGWSGAGTRNIDADPLFVAPGAGDYRLGAGSPCIDAGHDGALPMDEHDLDDDDDRREVLPHDLGTRPRITDDADVPDTGCGTPGVVDMGAYEHAGAATPVRRGDLDGDLTVDGADLVLLVERWGPCADDCCPADLDLDGAVTARDLATLLGSWGSSE